MHKVHRQRRSSHQVIDDAAVVGRVAGVYDTCRRIRNYESNNKEHVKKKYITIGYRINVVHTGRSGPIGIECAGRGSSIVGIAIVYIDMQRWCTCSCRPASIVGGNRNRLIKLNVISYSTKTIAYRCFSNSRCGCSNRTLCIAGTTVHKEQKHRYHYVLQYFALPSIVRGLDGGYYCL